MQAGWYEQLLERVTRLEAEMYKQEFWKRPVPPPPPQVEVPATNVVWLDEPSGHVVHVTFDFNCAGCEGEVREVVRVRRDTPQGFLHRVKCEKGHFTNVRFPHRVK